MKVFLSYAREDQEWAARLVEILKQGGLEVWDPAAELYPGDNWQLRTGKALEEAEAMVVLVSPEMADSEWVQQEWQYALGEIRFKNRVIPVIVRPTQEMPWILRRLPTLEGQPEEVGRKIVEALAPSASPRTRAGSR